MIVAKIYFDGANPLILPVGELSHWLETELAHGERDDLPLYKIELAWMSRNEFNALDEHQGW